MQEDLKVNIPDVAVMKTLPGEEFTRAVVMSLAAYDLKTPGFNFLAKANMVTPVDDHLYFYPPEHQGFIGASLAATREYDETGDVSQPTRDRYIVEYTKDSLRRMDEPKDTEEFKTFSENVVAFVQEGINNMNNPPAPKPAQQFPTISANWTQKL